MINESKQISGCGSQPKKSLILLPFLGLGQGLEPVMDPNLTCIDPNLLQLSQLLEEDEEPTPATNVNTLAAVEGKDERDKPGKDKNDLGLGCADLSHETETFSESRKRPAAAATADDATDVGYEDKREKLVDDPDSLMPTVMYAASIAEAQGKIRDHEKQFGVQFRRHKNPKNFGRSDWRGVLSKKKIYWDDRLVPYIKAASDTCIYECHHGPDHDSGRKKKRKLNIGTAATKKIGCAARIVMEEQVRFQQYEAKMESNVRNLRFMIRKVFSEGGDGLEGERRIRLMFVGEHNHATNMSSRHHDLKPNETLRQPLAGGTLDPAIVDKIHQLVRHGCVGLKDIQMRLHRLILADLGVHPRYPGKTVPTRKDLLNHVSHAKAQYEKFLTEQLAFKKFADHWRTEQMQDMLHFRPHQMLSSSTELTVSDAALSEDTWIRIKQLEKEGAVFLMNDENQVLAFGKKLPFFQGPPDLQWFEITEVMSAGTKSPNQDVLLKEGATTLWPANLVLDVVVEAFDEKEEVEGNGDQSGVSTNSASSGDSLLLVFQVRKFQNS
jgi:hypothetical protein